MIISRRNIISNIAALVSGDVISQIFSVITMLITTRALGVESVGQYIACFSLVRLSSFLFEIGLNNWMLRAGARTDYPLGDVIGSNMALKFSLGLFWFGLIEILGLFLNDKTYPAALLRLSTITIWVESIFVTLLISFRVKLKNQITAVLSTISAVILFVLTILLFYLNHTDPGKFALARLLTGLISTFLSGIIIFSKHKISVNLLVIKDMLRDSPPFMLSVILYNIYSQVDITMIALLLGNEMVGIYGPISKILNYLFVVPRSINGVILPLLSRLWEENKRGFFQNTRKFLFLLTLIGGLIWLASGLFGEHILRIILGMEFELSVEILRILNPIIMLKAGSYTLASALIALGWQNRRVIAQLVSALLNIGINLVIINKYGIIGVAWVYVLSETVLLFGYFLLFLRRKKFQDKFANA